MRDFFALLWLAALLVYEGVPALLAHVGRYLAWRRRELRREQMQARIMRRLLRNPSELDLLRDRLESEEVVA
jgi:hypothetical protein